MAFPRVVCLPSQKLIRLYLLAPQGALRRDTWRGIFVLVILYEGGFERGHAVVGDSSLGHVEPVQFCFL